MPCRDDFQLTSSITAEQKINDLTALLCKACTMLDESGDLGRDGELTTWYNTHVQQDVKRIARLMRSEDVISTLDIKTLRAIEGLIDADLDKS